MNTNPMSKFYSRRTGRKDTTIQNHTYTLLRLLPNSITCKFSAPISFPKKPTDISSWHISPPRTFSPKNLPTDILGQSPYNCTSEHFPQTINPKLPLPQNSLDNSPDNSPRDKFPQRILPVIFPQDYSPAAT